MTQELRNCKRCKRPRPITAFCSPQDYVCDDCKPDDRFVRRMRALGKTEGVGALKNKINDYRRLVRLTEEAMAGITTKP